MRLLKLAVLVLAGYGGYVLWNKYGCGKRAVRLTRRPRVFRAPS
jgi:hypothetical protein